MKKSELRQLIREEIQNLKEYNKVLNESIQQKTPRISKIRNKMGDGYRALQDIQHKWLRGGIEQELEDMGYTWGKDFYYDVYPMAKDEDVASQLMNYNSVQLVFEFNSPISQQEFENILKKSGIKKSNYQINSFKENRIEISFINKQ